ncbi:response regulator [Paenibacillus sp. TH7-28]
MSEVSTILVVDDDQSIVELLSDFLEYENFRVITACDTVQAWTWFEQNSIHCIVMPQELKKNCLYRTFGIKIGEPYHK